MEQTKMEQTFDFYSKILLTLLSVLLIILIVCLFFSKISKVNFAIPHAMDYISTYPDYVEWMGYYTFDYNYFLKVNSLNRIIGDAIKVGDEKYILAIIPAASSRKVGDWIKLECETVSNDDDVYTFIFENSSVATDFNQVYAYHDIHDDSPSVYLEVIDNGGKRWVMFGGYNDI